MGDINKSGWDYRVVKLEDYVNPAEHWFQMAEVYYNKDGSIKTWCKATPGGATIDELNTDLIAMFHGFFERPVLTQEELNDYLSIQE